MSFYRKKIISGGGGGSGDANINDAVITLTETWSSKKIDDTKANKIHAHEIADVNGLEEALQNATPTVHTHQIDDIELLQEALDNKSDINHSHEIADVNGLQDALDNVTAGEHNHEINEVEGLQDELDNKANIVHQHQISDVELLQDFLDDKADITHAHEWSEILNKPSSSVINIDKAVTDMHIHDNKDVLDFLEGDGNVLTYKGHPIDGYRAVQTMQERDNIPMSERKDGLLCLVLSDGSVWYLKGGIDNAFWEIFSVAAGGATSANGLHYTPSGNLTSTNVQAAIDELEAKKANMTDIYTKAETDNKLANHTHDYQDLTNLPDLSSLHEHTNIGTINKFSESQGELAWDGKTLGTMIGDIYDSDGDGVVDKSATLQGLLATIQQLNYSVGLTGNIQQQINAISAGAVFKGEYPTYAEMMIGIPAPSKGDWIFIVTDETKGNARTQYYHDGTDWIYGGGAAQVGEATETTLGGIMLTGALGNPLSTAQNPLLNATGVTAGLYKNANIVVEEDGRISHVVEGGAAFINDTNVSDEETWSSEKVQDELNTKAVRNHTHPQLHDSNMLGDVSLDIGTLSDKRVIMYNAVSGKAEWTESQGGKVYVGSRVISGDYRLAAGANMSLFIDEASKTITLNSTYQGAGGNGVPTLTEITQTIDVPFGQTVEVSLDAAFNKYEIRTLEMKNTERMMMDISIFDQAIDGRRIYYSNQEVNTYDIVNVPCHDKDQTEKIHLSLTNYGTKDTTASIVITTTNLI